MSNFVTEKHGDHGACLASKVIWKSVPYEQQFSVNNSGIIEFSLWKQHNDSSINKTFYIRSDYNKNLPDTCIAIEIGSLCFR